jgi:hypothetical protein
MDKTLTDALALAALHGLTDKAVAAAVEAATAARLAEAERPGLVPMTHPDLPDRPQLVDPEAVEVYERSGWRLARDAPGDEAEAVTVKATKTTAKTKEK